MIRNGKKWVFLYLLVLAIGIAAYMAICYKANTLGYFTNIQELPYYNTDDYVRKIKSTYLYEHKGEYDGVLIGGSKCGAIDPSLMTELTGLKYYNMYMNIGNLTDYLRYATFLAEKCEVKEITLMLSGFETKYDDQSSRGNAFKPPAILTGNIYDQVTEFLSYLMTDIETTYEELRNPITNHPDTSDYILDGMRNRYKRVEEQAEDPDKRIQKTVLKGADYQMKKLFRQAASSQTARPLCLDCLRQIVQVCEENDVHLRVVMGPSFLLDKGRYECEEYYSYFEEVVGICGEVWDFSGYNRYNMNPYNFYDRSHYSKELASLMLYRIFDNEKAAGYEDYGLLLTPDNVHEAMQERRKFFEKYKEEYETTGTIVFEKFTDDSYIPWPSEWTSPGMEIYNASM